MDDRRSSPSTARNRAPILEVLRRLLPAEARVLELASGAGEHAVYFARAMPGLVWRPSDPDPAARASIAAWIAAEDVRNVLAPVAIDVSAPHWDVEDERYDALVAINMIHIAPFEATRGLMAGARRLLGPRGQLITYGPYTREGRFTAPSNEAFDAWLKAQDERFGVRDVGEVEAAAGREGLALREVVEMPANNLMLVFERAPPRAG